MLKNLKLDNMHLSDSISNMGAIYYDFNDDYDRLWVSLTKDSRDLNKVIVVINCECEDVFVTCFDITDEKSYIEIEKVLNEELKRYF